MIDYNQLTAWEDEFIHTGIADRVLQCKTDLEERQGYATDLEVENFENDLHHAIDDAAITYSKTISTRNSYDVLE